MNEEIVYDGKHITTIAAVDENTYNDVTKPKHYTETKIEPIDVIEAWGLGFCLGNVIKYIARAGRKESAALSPKEKEIQDLKKSKWYLERRIKELEKDLCD